ncbi:MAG TPA: polysaccharide deacetylase family protein, partial [Pseudoneobacillus sp.]|nr:polysaccharide deacetylase family protein [Pseudoneobacillus sp.]
MKRVFIVASISVLCLIVLGYGTLKLMNSRTFQFFGGLVNHVETDERVVALTFDDGPNEKTDEILQILKENDIKATFYLIGDEIKKHNGEADKIALAGHELGNHTYSHKRMVFKSLSYVSNEIEKTDKLIRAAGYKGQITFRPPYFKKLFVLPFYLNKHDRKTILVDVEPDSYPDIASDSEKTIDYVVNNAKPGSIILLHVWYDSRKESLKSIDGIVKG